MIVALRLFSFPFFIFLFLFSIFLPLVICFPVNDIGGKSTTIFQYLPDIIIVQECVPRIWVDDVCICKL